MRFVTFGSTKCREKKAELIPPIRIPFFWIQYQFYVRFFEFSVFQFFGLLDPYGWSRWVNFLGPMGPGTIGDGFRMLRMIRVIRMIILNGSGLLSRRYEKTKLSGRPLRSKNRFSYCRSMFGWFGEVGGHRKNHAHRCATSLFVTHRWKVKKTTKIMFWFITCNPSPILFFWSQKP